MGIVVTAGLSGAWNVAVRSIFLQQIFKVSNGLTGLTPKRLTLPGSSLMFRPNPDLILKSNRASANTFVPLLGKSKAISAF